MSECDQFPRLDAFYDGELDTIAAAEVQNHLPTCPTCQEALEKLHRMTRLLSDAPELQSAPSDPLVIARVHRALNSHSPRDESRSTGAHTGQRTNRDDSQRVLFRMGGWLTAAAASLLIISAAWWTEQVPPSRSTVTFSNHHPTGVNDWQRLATTFQPDTVFSIDPAPMGETQFAEATDWMLNGLEPGGR